MSEILQQARDMNPNLQVFALITMAPTNPVVNEINQTREVFADYSEIKLLKHTISERKVYRDAMSEGMGVVEMNNKKASLEFQDVAEELLGNSKSLLKGVING